MSHGAPIHPFKIYEERIYLDKVARLQSWNYAAPGEEFCVTVYFRYDIICSFVQI